MASINNWTKERKFRKLTEESRKSVKVLVIRNGTTVPMNSEELLVGDVIELNTGSSVPADGIYLQGTALALHLLAT